jgi:hypothetical protein
MNKLLDVPLASVIALSAERAVLVIRTILRSECGYAKISPTVLTISSRLTIADGGIDAEINAPPEFAVPSDCFFQSGLTGFQIKSGTSFKPWMPSAIRSELLNSNGNLSSEVDRLVQRRGRYLLICTGHDLTPEQRNESRSQIAKVLADAGFVGYENLIDVHGASQLAEFAERYPGTASLLAADPIHEAWVLEEWQRDAHMANTFEVSPEQAEIISQIRAGLQGEIKHIRVLGEPGLGKTRIVLEAVKDADIAPYVLYIQHGSKFGNTKLFRQLLRDSYNKPLVLVIDELPEGELSDIWRHLKPRCGQLKVISLDHGRDETHDNEIVRLNAPRLTDAVIKKILATRLGESRELDRWVALCEGSPRVAQAVADNLRANPSDILKPPSTVPVWARFLHGYGNRDEALARQIDCVTQHLALFSRFGYEAPIESEADYIAQLVQKTDPSIGRAQFQEIVHSLRARRVLQGSRTLFFVPKALHIYLWKQFWERYGRGFDFAQTFQAMPESLHTWFMNMFKFAEGSATAKVIDDILSSDGIFSQSETLTSAKGSRFINTLAEANSVSVLRLLEATIGKWTDQEILSFKQERQNLVWALEKIAVWPAFTVRAINVLARLAINENAENSNNATGTLVALFRIGPESAVTESSPQARLPAMLRLLRSSANMERRLGLKAMSAALDSRGLGYRIVGPEYQGLKERAKLWVPATYAEWWQAMFDYFQVLVDETRSWSPLLRSEVCLVLLEAVKSQLQIPLCTDLSLQVLSELSQDIAMSPGDLNSFFWHWQEYDDDGKQPELTKKIRSLERQYTKQNLSSRFQRYVIDVDWQEWDDEFRERKNKPKNRAKLLVNALAKRVVSNPEKLDQIQHLLSPINNAPALWYFGEKLAHGDDTRVLLVTLTSVTMETKHQGCLSGYLSALRTIDHQRYAVTINRFLDAQETAWLGAMIALRGEYDDTLFMRCLDALNKRWINPQEFSVLRYGKSIESIPSNRIESLFRHLNTFDMQEAITLLVGLLCCIPFNDESPFTSDFVFEVITKAIPSEDHHLVMSGYDWKDVCSKLVSWEKRHALPLLNALLNAMGKEYRLSYDSYVEPLANELVKIESVGAWEVLKTHFEESLPQWRSDLLNWLKGGLSRFDGNGVRSVIADLPITNIFEWIEVESEPRSALIAHAAPGTLDDELGGQITRELLLRYGQFEGVRNGISATFHSGSWTGPASEHYKRKREKFRQWLAAGFEFEVTQWIESEIEYLDRNIEREEISEERSRFD